MNFPEGSKYGHGSPYEDPFKEDYVDMYPMSAFKLCVEKEYYCNNCGICERI